MKLIYRLLLSIMFCFPIYLCKGQDINLAFHQFLPKNTVNTTCIIKDKSGFLWVGSDKGLYRFNGLEFISFQEIYGDSISIANYTIEALYRDRLGWIWVGTQNNGLISFHPMNHTIKTFRNNLDDPKSFPGTKARGFFEDSSGQLWILTTGKGLSLYDRNTETFKIYQTFDDEVQLQKYNHYPLDLHSPYLDLENPNIVWIGSLYGICMFNTQSKIAEYYLPPQPWRLSNGVYEPPKLRGFIRDDSGIFWGVTWGYGLLRFDPRSKDYTIIRCQEKVKNDIYSCLNGVELLSWDDNTLLIYAAGGNGWMLFDKTSYTFTKIEDIPFSNSLPNSPPNDIYIDDKGRKWIATQGSGLIKLLPPQKGIDNYNLNISLIEVLQHPSKEVLYGISRDGILLSIDLMNKQVRSHFVTNPIVPEEHFFRDILFDADERLWIVGFRDLYYFNETTSSIESLKWPEWIQKRKKIGYYYDMVIDDNGVGWLSSQSGGLGQIDFVNKTVQIHTFEEDNPNSLKYGYSFGNLYKDYENRIWGSGKGVFYFDNDKKHFVNYPSPVRAHDDGPSFTMYTEFLMDSTDHLWMPYELNHIALIDPKDSIHIPFQSIEEVRHLPNANVEGIAQDTSGYIWLTSKNGLTRIKISSHEVDHFGTALGLKNLQSINLSQNNELLIAYNKGFYIINPDSLEHNTSTPTPIIDQFNIFDKTYPFDLSNQIKLGYRDNFFSFDFSAIDFDNSDKIEYAYKLEGVDKKWIVTDNRHHASYTNIGGGDYTFKVKCRNICGNWSENIAQLNITILPPFWRTLWFWALISLLILASIYTLYSSRIKKIKREEQLKTEFNKQLAEVEMKALRAQMNPHFLFNSLNAIKFYVLKRSKEKAVHYLNDFSKLIRLVLHNSSQQTISLAQELEALNLYINIERMRFDEGFDYYFNIDKVIDPETIMVPPLIFQPYAENAIWHGLMHKTSGRGRLTLTIKKTGESILCTIEDNGIGRKKAKEAKSKTAQKNKSMGMTITKHRMDISKYLNNMIFDVSIHDLKDDNEAPLGTKVIIEIKFTP